MRISNDSINFQSKIKFVNEVVYHDKLASLCPKANFVGYPWTIETLNKGTNLHTNGVLDCIIGCIVNGKNTIMFHLATRDKNQAAFEGVKNFDIKNIDSHLKEAIDFSEKDTHGIILGGFKQINNVGADKGIYFKQIKNLFEKYKIPCSIFGPRKDLPIFGFGEYALLYEKENDTFWITNSKTDSDYRYAFQSLGGNEIEVMDDGIVHHKFEPVSGDLHKYYKTRVKTNLEEFFKNQFHEVKLCKFDEWA